MTLKFTFSHQCAVDSDVWVVGSYKNRDLTSQAQDLDMKTGGSLTRALKNSHFKGDHGNILEVASPQGLPCSRLILLGLGEKQKLSEHSCEGLGSKLYDYLRKTLDESLCIDLGDLSGDQVLSPQATAHIAYGILLRSWCFDKYRTQEKDENIPSLASVQLMTSFPKEAADSFKTLESIAEGVFLTRDLVSEPPNVLNPETYATRLEDLKNLGLEIKILGVKEMKKLGMNALLGVGQGSAKESRLVCLKWMGAKEKQTPPLAFVGKGVCFDTGGISIKPSQGMEDMKSDMAGSAVVVGLMKALASRKAKINAVGVVGLVENMPGGNAQRPSDVVFSMSGQTIEILNTDAEGRLVLADALWYTQETYKPKLMIDIATLTGAIVIALGEEYAGLFSNNDEIAQHLMKSGERTGEKLWRLPLHGAYDKEIDSSIADVANIGKSRGAGSILAAQFLQRFVNKVPWAHLDIAAVAWSKTAHPSGAKGATAFGVRLLDKFISTYYESPSES